MRIISKRTLKEFWIKHPHAEQPLYSWHQLFLKKSFLNPHEVKLFFGTADFVGDNRIIFNICGNHFRLVVKINYIKQIVFILFVGTHEDYNNIKDISRL